MRAIFQGFGLMPDRFMRFDRTMRIRRLILPAPSLEEENVIRRAYATSCNALGRRIAAGRITTPDPRPVFQSEEKLRFGVQRLQSEAEISVALARHGVEIMVAELMPIEDQVVLRYNRPYVASFANSVLHTSVFAPGRNGINLSYGQALMSNYLLVDRANRTKGHYLRPTPGTWTGSQTGTAS